MAADIAADIAAMDAAIMCCDITGNILAVYRTIVSSDRTHVTIHNNLIGILDRLLTPLKIKFFIIIDY